MNELTNSLRKKYASLANAKGRKEWHLFMAQGEKCVLDTIEHFELDALLTTYEWIDEHRQFQEIATIVKSSDMERISTLSTPPQVIAIYKMPQLQEMPIVDGSNLYLALDCVQDPGNLGTIIRVADWMGVTEIFASKDTADVWNPKVVQATMGAISRVNVRYLDLSEFLAKCDTLPIYGTFLDGDDIYKSLLSKGGIIVMGNEGNGISKQVAQHVSKRLLIPSFPPDRPTSESLNVAIATAITLSEFRRNG